MLDRDKYLPRIMKIFPGHTFTEHLITRVVITYGKMGEVSSREEYREALRLLPWEVALEDDDGSDFYPKMIIEKEEYQLALPLLPPGMDLDCITAGMMDVCDERSIIYTIRCLAPAHIGPTRHHRARIRELLYAYHGRLPPAVLIHLAGYMNCIRADQR